MVVTGCHGCDDDRPELCQGEGERSICRILVVVERSVSAVMAVCRQDVV